MLTQDQIKTASIAELRSFLRFHPHSPLIQAVLDEIKRRNQSRWSRP